MVGQMNKLNCSGKPLEPAATQGFASDFRSSLHPFNLIFASGKEFSESYSEVIHHYE